MAVDFTRLAALDKYYRKEKPEAFDVSPDGMWHDDINPAIYNMSAAVIDDMEFCRKWQRGIGLVTGGVGSGKTGFITSTSYKGKLYFGRTPILDYKPTSLFGYYQLFNQQTYVSMLEHMNGIIKGEIVAEVKKTREGEKASKLLEQATKEWLDTEGQSYFQHSVLVLDELKRYHDKRRPHNPIGLLLTDMYVIWRHLDILILGATTDEDYLDFRVFKELSLKVNCVSFGQGNTWALIHRVKRVSPRGVIEVADEPDYYSLNLFKQREILNGAAYKDIYNTTNLISLKIPKSMRREG